jgi:hypothetical protein
MTTIHAKTHTTLTAIVMSEPHFSDSLIDILPISTLFFYRIVSNMHKHTVRSIFYHLLGLHITTKTHKDRVESIYCHLLELHIITKTHKDRVESIFCHLLELHITTKTHKDRVESIFCHLLGLHITTKTQRQSRKHFLPSSGTIYNY